MALGASVRGEPDPAAWAAAGGVAAAHAVPAAAARSHRRPPGVPPRLRRLPRHPAGAHQRAHGHREHRLPAQVRQRPWWVGCPAVGRSGGCRRWSVAHPHVRPPPLANRHLAARRGGGRRQDCHHPQGRQPGHPDLFRGQQPRRGAQPLHAPLAALRVANCVHRKWHDAVPPCRWTGRPWASM